MATAGSNDPRVSLGTKCSRARQREAALQAEKQDFFGTLGKIGQLDILNDIGGSKIGKGLRTLHSISELVRVGKPPNEVTMDENGGAWYVLDQTVGNQREVNQASVFNPMIANRGYQQAKDIYNKVKQGHFDLDDIPSTISDLHNLSKLIDRIFTNRDKDPREYKLCEPSPYAMDLIRYAPKFKYMFIVEFKFSDAYAQTLNEAGKFLAFVIKSSTRPKVDFEYEEVNMYNFRTQVIKRAKYDQLTMKFLDDNQNSAGRFYEAYLSAMSPQTNMTSKIAAKQPFEDSSMNFSNKNTRAYRADRTGGSMVTSHQYASSTGSLIDYTTINILSEVKLYHIFDYGRRANQYTFINPKITSMELDDLDMSVADVGNEMVLNFMYDSIHILSDINLGTAKNTSIIKDLSGNHGRAVYPIISIHDPGEANNKSGEDDSFFGKIAKDASGVIDSALGAVGDAFDYLENKAGGWLQSTYDVIDKSASDAYDSGKRTVGDAMKKLGIF